MKLNKLRFNHYHIEKDQESAIIYIKNDLLGV